VRALACLLIIPAIVLCFWSLWCSEEAEDKFPEKLGFAIVMLFILGVSLLITQF